MTNLTKLTDSEVVKIIREKDKEIYSEIIKRYEKKLMRYAMYMLNDEITSAEVVQEAFIKAYINLNSFETKKQFSSWIYRIVHNEAMNAIKKQKKHISINENLDFESQENIEDKLIKKELIKNTNKCLEEMPLIYKEPLSLFFLEEKSYDEISDILRIPTGTVGTRINRAKSLMKKICQEK